MLQMKGLNGTAIQSTVATCSTFLFQELLNIFPIPCLPLPVPANAMHPAMHPGNLTSANACLSRHDSPIKQLVHRHMKVLGMCLAGYRLCWLIDWLVGWLVGRLVGRLVGCVGRWVGGFFLLFAFAVEIG